VPTANKKLIAWVDQAKALCKPTKVHWCTGSSDEYEELCDLLVKSGTFTRLNEDLRPNSFLARSDPRDVGRVEDCTFVCSEAKENTGMQQKFQS
jgi:phosphoenolpyruvate carboxykinase (GTP)